MKRSKHKGPFILRKNKSNNKLILLERSIEITSQVIGKTFHVHNGQKYLTLSITEEMVGHKVGEFIPTRENFVFKKKKKK